MNIFIITAITISGLFYLYFLLTVLLVNHYREPVKTYVKGPQNYQLFLIIPVLNEGAVIAKTLQRLSDEISELPPTIDTQIIAVDDNSTDDSLAAMVKTSSPYLQILHRTTHPKSGKGAVLNTAVQYLQTTLAPGADPQKTVIGVLDADAFMSSADLAQVIAHFEHDARMTMLQTGVRIYNRNNWLCRMQNFEFMGVNNATQQLRNRLGEGIASGNGQFVRLDLARRNPWGDRLLEDLEFTLRTWLLSGQKTVFDHTLVVQQQAVERLRPFFRQRVRWCQGAVQCMPYLSKMWHSPYLNFFQKFDTSFWILMPIFGCIIPVTGLIALLVLISRSLNDWHLGWHHLAIISIVTVTLFICLLAANVYQRNYANIQQKVPFLPALLASFGFQAYLLIIGLTPYVAIYRQLRGRTNWAKTRHNGVPVSLPAPKLKNSYLEGPL